MSIICHGHFIDNVLGTDYLKQAVPTRYPIRAVTKLTGISADTLRAWERRYQAVVPERSGRGRQYNPTHIARLRRLGQLVARGHAIGSIASRSDEELDALLAPPLPPEPSAPAPALLAPVLSAIESFDAARVSDELSRLAAVLAPRDLLYQAVVPLMQEVGSRWHEGRFAIAQERLVSQALRNLLGSMLRMFRQSTPQRRIVAATPVGESHEFGLLAASMLAALSGIEVVYLGTDLPADQTARAARSVSAQMALLGITIVTDRTQTEVAALAAALPASTTLCLGGAGVGDLDFSQMARAPVVAEELQAFEDECRRWRDE